MSDYRRGSAVFGTNDTFEVELDFGQGNCACGNPLQRNDGRFCSRCANKNSRKHDSKKRDYAGRESRWQ